MKICKYCNTENKEEEQKCSSCGGNEFSHKCDNCGNIYDTGNFCPHCGVKAGSVPKYCSNCKKNYFTNVCPDCGYKASENTDAKTVNVNLTIQNEARHKHTFLWVLGWICAFPIPLTIIVTRSKKLHIALKIAIVAVAWLVYVGILARGSDFGKTEAFTASDTDTEVTTVASVEANDNLSIDYII